VDWGTWKNGVPPGTPEGSSAPLDLQLLLAYDWAARMEDALGFKPLAAQYGRDAVELRQTVQHLYWEAGRQLFADTPLKAEFSQQTNVLAILARVVDGPDARALTLRILSDSSLTQCSI